MQCIEPDFVLNFVAEKLQLICHKRCESVDTLTDGSKAFCSVVNSISSRNYCQKNLSGTDVGGCFFTTDVLFAGLKSHSVRRISVRINRNTDDSTRNIAFVGITSGKKCCVWPTESHWDTKSLGCTHNYVRAHCSGRFHDGECK